MNENEKIKLLIFGDSQVVLKALEQYIQLVPTLSHCEVIDTIEYNSSLLTPDKLKGANVILYGLYRRYGTRHRADGVASLQSRLKFGRKGLIYCFGVPEVANNPLIWDITSPMTLEEKLVGINTVIDQNFHLDNLLQFFCKDIFVVDGH